MDNPSPYLASTLLDREYLQQGKHFSPVLLDNEILLRLGLVTAYWGAFENRLNMAIGGFLQITGRDEPNWASKSFRTRKELFIQVTTPTLPENLPRHARMKQVAATAADLHWRRNVYVHGDYECTIAAHSRSATYVAKGFHRGREVRLPVEVDLLSKLYHDIGHLTAELIFAVHPNVEFVGGFGPWPDADLLKGERPGTTHPSFNVKYWGR